MSHDHLPHTLVSNTLEVQETRLSRPQVTEWLFSCTISGIGSIQGEGGKAVIVIQMWHYFFGTTVDFTFHSGGCELFQNKRGF